MVDNKTNLKDMDHSSGQPQTQLIPYTHSSGQPQYQLIPYTHPTQVKITEADRNLGLSMGQTKK